MSRRELYAWCSLGLTLAIFGYYIIAVFGLPSGLENHEAYIKGLIWKVIGIAFLVELVLDVLSYTKLGGVSKDERDMLIESKGFRNAYYFVMAALVGLVINMLISHYLSEAAGQELLLAVPFRTFNVLVFILFFGSMIKSGTQLIYYKTGFLK